MKARAFVFVSVTIFTLVGVLHLVRLVRRVPVHFGETAVPMSASWIGLVAAVTLVLWGLRVARD